MIFLKESKKTCVAWSLFLYCALSAALLHGEAIARARTVEETALFDPSRTTKLLDALADDRKALATDPKAALSHWKKVLLGQWRSKEHQCVTLLGLAHDGARDFVTIAHKGKCDNEETSARVELNFRNDNERAALRTALNRRFGASLIECSSPTIAHWRLRPGISLRWSTDDHQGAELTLFATEPSDANCPISAADKTSRVDPAQIAALFQRIKTDPIPWRDADKMREWLSAYGSLQAEVKLKETCLRSVIVEAPFKLSGASVLGGVVKPTGCDDIPPKLGDSALFLFFSKADMFARDTLLQAATEVFGKPATHCSASLDWHYNGTGISLTPSRQLDGAFLIIGAQLEGGCPPDP